MTTPMISDYLKYANLQMAAEAFLVDDDGGILSDNELKAALIEGNKHASFFTESEATKFNNEWQVLAQCPNTTTGFSGTLLKNRTTGELVMSFRSTEFIDDATCDNQVTNKMEIKEHGWAFGQIADMEAWYKDLKVDGAPLSEKQFSVTGYSLGGHLATAFNILHSEAKATYTFNGAGVGDISKNLNELIADFDRMRKNADGNQVQFTDANMQSFYSAVKSRFNSGERPTDADLFQLENTSTGSPSEKLLLRQALTNLQTIYDEIARVRTLSSGSATSPSNPIDVSASKIDATHLDYQIAVLTVERFTSSYGTDIVSSGWDAITNRNIKFKFPAFYDLFGANSPSGVANSQWHYGEPVPLFIEDQPLYRGSVVWDAVKESALYSDVKFLVQGYANNDFGDTHSLVLIVDSLNIQNALYTLDPTLRTADLNTLFKAASNLKAESGLGGQGKCEGDVLENILNALARMVRGNTTGQLTGKTEGNTWWIAEDRTAFYAKLNSVLEHQVFQDLAGKVKIELSSADLASSARDEFSNLLSLLTLSPFVLKATVGNEAAVDAALQANWQTVYAAWKTDVERIELERAAGHGVPDDLNYSDTYLRDRAAMLDWKVRFNQKNLITTLTNPHEDVLMSQWQYFKDSASGEEIVLGKPPTGQDDRQQILFGSEESETLAGLGKDDHLYGGGGNDTLSGGDGADRLEGGEDNDSLTGGEGRDTLLGGTDDDTLEGGKDNDLLIGGAGHDTYKLASGDGWNWIVDSDGQGYIEMDGATLGQSEIKWRAPNVWQEQVGGRTVTYSLYDRTENGETFKVLSIQGSSGAWVKRWQQGALGLSLPDATTVPAPPATRTIVGDLAPLLDANGSTSTDVLGNIVVTASAEPGRTDTLYDSTDNDLIRGLGGDDLLLAHRGGADTLDGGDGNDLVSGGAGDDRIDGGTGTDALIGGAGNDVIQGGEGNDILFGAQVNYSPMPPVTGPVDDLWAEGRGWQVYFQGATLYFRGLPGGADPNDGDDTLSGGAGNDMLFGSWGNDVLDGEDGFDSLYAGAGDDLVRGGADNDVLYGDMDRFMATPDAENGNDILDGGTGNDLLIGEGGSDQLVGGEGDDHLFGDDNTVLVDANRLAASWYGDDYLDGGAGNDMLYGSVGNDVLHGGTDNDTLYGGQGDDSLYGEDGNDTLSDGEGDNFLSGGAGDDNLAAGNGTDILDGGLGSDKLYGGAGDDSLEGGAGSDTLQGGDGKDVLAGGADDDQLFGEKGDDQLAGGEGTDTLVGGEGADTLWGDQGDDQLFGEAGDDSLDGGAGNDQIQGGGDNDLLLGKGGNDVLFGEAGNDTLSGSDGDDVLQGGDGNDLLNGGLGLDVLQGAQGDDVYVLNAGDGNLSAANTADTIVDEGGSDVIRFGAGITAGTLNVARAANGQYLAINYTASDWVLIQNVPGGTIERFVFDDGTTLSLAELISRQSSAPLSGTDDQGNPMQLGGTSDDTLTATANYSTVSGGRGNDTLTVSGNNATILYSKGDGTDQVSTGGSGNLLRLGTGISAADLRLGLGSLAIQIGSDPANTLHFNTFSADTPFALRPFDRVEFSDGSQMSYEALLGLGFDLHGTEANDAMTGSSVVDRMVGGAGNDTLSAGAGDDVLDGGNGDDVLAGGSGNDTYRFERDGGRDIIDNAGADGSTTDQLSFGSGILPMDLILVRSGDALEISLRDSSDQVSILNHYAGQAIDRLTFDDGTVWTAEQIDAHLSPDPSAGNDTRIGTPGDDSLNAGAGNDLLSGLAGNDSLLGGDGDDTLIGGQGTDTLDGGTGNDTYLYARGDGSDILQMLDTTLGKIDRLVFGAEITPGAVAIGRKQGSGTEDLVLTLRDTQGNATTDQITVKNFFGYADNRAQLDRIEFADGTVWTVETIRSALLTGTDGADNLYGFLTDDRLDGLGGNDTITSGDGNDTVSGGEGKDTLYGNNGNDRLLGDGGNDTLYGGLGNDELVGGSGDDYIQDGNGADVFDGGLGNDTLRGWDVGDSTYRFGRHQGHDLIIDGGQNRVNNGNDRILLDVGIRPEDVSLYRIRDGKGYDSLVVVLDNGPDQVWVQSHFSSDPYDNQIERIEFADGTVWNAADITLRAIQGTYNQQTGTAGDDIFIVDTSGDSIIEAAASGYDVVRSSAFYTLPANVERLELTGPLDLDGTGNDLNNVIVGNIGNNKLNGLGGNDTLIGGLGDDQYVVGNPSRYFTTSDAPYESDVVVEAADEGYDLVSSNNYHQALADNVESLTMLSSICCNIIYRDGSNNTTLRRVSGNALNNVIDATVSSSAGFSINGGAGADTMLGGAGSDTYFVDNAGDRIVETDARLKGDGVTPISIDTVVSSISYTLGANLENLSLSGSDAINGVGTSQGNILKGNANANALYGLGGNDVLYGGLGADTLIGGSGDDLYVLDVLDYYNGYPQLGGALSEDAESGDAIVELQDDGVDTVRSVYSYTLGANLENLELTPYVFTMGTVRYGYPVRATGNALNNQLTGNAGANILDGGSGADTMIGKEGDDTYYVDDAGDVVVEVADGGVDTVYSAISYSLAQTVENLVLTGTGNDIGVGNSGNNRLDGSQSTGANQLIGGIGDDTYVLGAGDEAIELVGDAGTDTVISSSDHVLGVAIENLTLSGNDATRGTGNAGSNVLDGSKNASANVLVGLDGDDRYVVDSLDVIIETIGGGIDSVVTTGSDYTLGANVENLTIGSAVVSGNATGNELNNVLIGNDYANRLDGGLGGDTMRGGEGNDTYVVDNVADVIEDGGSAYSSYRDTVEASVSFVLADDLENLVLKGSAAISGTGNALDNQLSGAENSAANVLAGGLGSDSYTVGVGDTVIENFEEGIDEVNADFSYTLDANVENLRLTGEANINGTGNELDNNLEGNAGANTLDGRGGADGMFGYDGDDLYIVDNVGDVVDEAEWTGVDTVQSSVTYTLGTNIENLILTGSSAINGTGNAADNILRGNGAANLLKGGAGNDTYYVSSGDTVTENANAGTDTVISDVSWTLGSNLENLVLAGSAAINGTGNTQNNTLYGNAGNNVLNGGTGADTLVGGLGNDTYFIDNAGDVIVEEANAGTDLVQSSLTFTLAANFENLTLTGTSAVNGTGNALANTLTGNSANNVLDGGAGADTLIGGAGNDTYVVDDAGDTVTESSNAGTDVVQASVSYVLGSNVEKLTLTGFAALNGTGNTLANTLTGNDADNVLDGGAGADTLVGGAGNDTYVIDNAGDVVTENAGAGVDLVKASVTFTLASNVENLTLTGTTAINGTGNAQDNVLIGNSAINTLTGGAGNDTLDGGAGADKMLGGLGDDTYTVDNASDVVTENASEGTDLINSSITLTLAANVEGLILTGTTAINGTGNTLNNLIRGNSGVNTLTGGTGNDILEGNDGNDILTDTTGSAFFNGGAGTDTITGGSSAELYLGGLGNDTLTTGGGNDVILFNKGDGQDTFAAGGTGSDTLSLGGAFAYNDLSLSKSSNDLVLKMGASDQITFKDWYAATPSKPVVNLQVIAEAMADFDAGGSNPLLDQRVENFNFTGLVSAFDAARTANPMLTAWGLSNALSSFQLAGSDSAAIGGDLAYQYGKNGTLAGIGLTAAQNVIGNASFGTNAQVLQPLASLQTGSVRLS